MSSRSLLASSAVIALVVVTTPACDLLKHRDQGADAGAVVDAAVIVDAAPPATVVDAAPPLPEPTTTATAATTAAVAPAKSAAPAGKGDCRCLPDQGSTEHGNNMRLSPTWKQPRCGCEASGVKLCQKQVKTCKERGSAACDESFDTVCKARIFPGLAGTACAGWDSQGNRGTGKLSCDFDGVDTYPRPAGGTCTGFTVDRKQVSGHVFCPGR